jgi:hypothetical protein
VGALAAAGVWPAPAILGAAGAAPPPQAAISEATPALAAIERKFRRLTDSRSPDITIPFSVPDLLV